MKIHRLLVLGVITLSASIPLGFTGTTANAKAVKTPASLRGTWYSYEPDYYSYAKVKITKYHFYGSGAGGTIKLSGVKFPKKDRGHAELSIYRSKKGYYTIGAYASDEWPSWKRVTHKGHPALRSISYGGSYANPELHTDYYYKTKAIAKHPTIKHYKTHKGNFTVSQYSDFSSSEYRTGYIDSTEANYKFYDYNKELEGPGFKKVFTVKNSLVPLKVKKGMNSDGETIYIIMHDGILGAEGDDYVIINPYNTEKVDSTTVSSQTTPYSGKGVLRHDINVKKIKTWMMDKPHDKSAFYKRVKGGWKYTGTF